MVKTSVIVSFYERVSHLRCCLSALARSSHEFHEVVIADDGSGPQAVEAVGRLMREYSFPIRHAWQPKDGFRLSATRNHGIRIATGDHLLFIDCDFVLLPGTVAMHRKAARPGRFVGAYCKYLPKEESEQLMASDFSMEHVESLYAGLPQRPISRSHWKFNRYRLAISLRLANPRKLKCSSHFSIHRRDIEAINGYDEAFRGWGGEDEDLAHRMILAGYQPYSIIDKARTLHVWHPSELGGKHWQTGNNVAYLNREHVDVRCIHGLRQHQESEAQAD